MTYAMFLEERGISKPCPKCAGFGMRSYSSTATWRGGIGGQMITADQCDGCWGSGDADAPWPSIRELEGKLRTKRQAEAQEAVAELLGPNLSMLRRHMDALATILEREARRRKLPEGIPQDDAFWWNRTLEYFASRFRNWGAVSEVKP